MDRVLVINVGSSSLKWSVLEAVSGRIVASRTENRGGPEASAAVFARAIGDVPPVDAVGHRFVHGGPRLTSSVVVDPDVRAELGELVELDPLHMKPAIETLDLARERWPDVSHVAVFDTAFHATIPEEARTYAIPKEWAQASGARRYGFHGLSVDHAVRRATAMLGQTPRKLMVLHLGSGSSITAVAAGRSIDTTMGFTPLEGVMMATRSGSIDPGLVLHLVAKLGLDAASVRAGLESRGGLLAVSGSPDLRQVLAEGDRGSAAAKLAYAMLVHSVRRCAGAMLGSLGGLDAVVFTGGIGENSSRLRADVASAFAFAGVRLDPTANEACTPDASIGQGNVAVLVVSAGEDAVILREVIRVLRVPA